MVTIRQKETKQKFLVEQLCRFVKRNDLEIDDFWELDELLEMTAAALRNGILSLKDIEEVKTAFDPEFLRETLHGRVLAKPCGYPGDYLLLDKMYTNHQSAKRTFTAWDLYFQNLAVSKAVRKRKEYFKTLVCQRALQQYNLRILNVVSGPGRELLELYHELPASNNVKITCIEVDDQAIAYSKNLNKNYLRKITYAHENIFKYESAVKYDLIWTGGLCNYLDETSLVGLLQRFKVWLNDGGEIVIGNVNSERPLSRNYMELLGDWHLKYRSSKELKHLASKASFSPNQITVCEGGEGVLLYLHLKS